MKYYIYPEEYHRGFTRTECLTLEHALMEKCRLQKITGFSWRVIIDEGIGSSPS